MGAGVNQDVVLRRWSHYEARELSTTLPPNYKPIYDEEKPPLANNFFQLALKSRICDAIFGGEDRPYIETLKPLLDYITGMWKISSDNLLKNGFNLEDCFTMLQLQIKERENNADNKEHDHLQSLLLKLEQFFSLYLEQFEGRISEWENTYEMANNIAQGCFFDEMIQLGNLLWKERPNIITFNYDCILENALEKASGLSVDKDGNPLKPPRFRQITNQDDEWTYCRFRWNRALSYGTIFDNVELPDDAFSQCVGGDAYYKKAGNELYDWRILKLHGSLNWASYLPENCPEKYKIRDQHKNDVFFLNRLLGYGYRFYGHVPIKRLIITPVLYKDEYYKHPLFQTLWRQAFETLSKCKRLVIIGYSFPSTDFHVRKLLLEAFKENSLEELIIVNPDSSTVRIAKELTHFNKPVISCYNLREFLAPVNSPN